MRVALLFIDGVGVGRADPAVNPLARAPYLLSRFHDAPSTPVPHGGHFTPVDATFGVPGRPQSASNQTAILTASDAPITIGRHVLGFPDRALRGLLAEHSLVKRLARAGRSATFANAYPAAYLDALGLERRISEDAPIELPAGARRKLRPSASTLAFSAARVPLRTFTDAARDLALTHDLTGERARARGIWTPTRTPSEAAEVFWRVTEEADFTFFEHYLADEAGHARDFEAARHALETFDAFLRALLATRPDEAHVLICSDHGNVEDLSTRGHTLNAVPTLYFGRRHSDIILGTVADVGRSVLKLLEVE